MTMTRSQEQYREQLAGAFLAECGSRDCLFQSQNGDLYLLSLNTSTPNQS
eukprot:CAMPEP_0113913668 /NCGR_PEP_ID=MMETSP0780_2-20120614/29735_1 /TAXON_ID=652834 /ORGANISM="Palpitomonas bilix" /LENGTH=49 /DNA_ID=CAMNT_0000911013 /DNA_START=80 /DNA_END=226 /DNA_ORIENTATION=+ /assembly_acc=CAM_ASM_000599